MHSVKKYRTVSWGLLSDLLLNFSRYNKEFLPPPPLVSSAPGAESNSAGGAELNTARGAKSNSAGGAEKKEGGQKFFRVCSPLIFFCPPSIFFLPQLKKILRTPLHQYYLRQKGRMNMWCCIDYTFCTSRVWDPSYFNGSTWKCIKIHKFINNSSNNKIP